MSVDFVPSMTPPAHQGVAAAYWFIFSGHRLLVETNDEPVSVPFTEDPGELSIDVAGALYLGTFRGHPCYAANGRSRNEAPAAHAFLELRSLFDVLDDALFEVALKAVHLVEWDRVYRFCSQCGGELRHRNDVRAKECIECGRLEFPRLSPAIIVLIEKGDTLLLARSPRFAGQFFSVLAGFVEPGESLEDAVHREVMEEVGIRIKDVEYFGSQPWPFPDSLMIGFTAQYDSGEILVDGEEIMEAGWYSIDRLPQIPGKLSIARKLIDSFIAKHGVLPAPDQS